MKKFSLFLLISILGVFLMAGSAWAYPLTIRPGVDDDLQDVFDTMTTAAPALSPIYPWATSPWTQDGINSSIDVTTDAIGSDAIWQITASGGSMNSFIVELASYATSNVFGVYDRYDPFKKVTIFSGAEGPGIRKSLDIQFDGSVLVASVDSGIDFGSGYFGYYLISPEGTFYSNTALNTDGFDHLYAFQGNDSDYAWLPNAALPGVFTDDEYVLAWEDLFGGGDTDFTDMVIMVESVTPVPEPATMFLFGLGIIGLVSLGRKKFFKK